MKCPYCNKGKVTRLINSAEFHYQGDEPITIEEPCEECGGTGEIKEKEKENNYNFGINDFVKLP